MIYFVFDVESIGLHGPAYAVGYVVINESGDELDSQCWAVELLEPMSHVDDYQWVKENIPPIPITHKTTDALRFDFWSAWIMWKERGAVMVSDCGWPVEARFLNWCVDWDLEERKWEGPYPLYDLSSIALAKGFDPLGTYERMENELPKHNPLCDARQSARKFLEFMKS